MVPCCGFHPTADDSDVNSTDSSTDSEKTTSSHGSGSTVTGTFFGYRRGRVSFCIHDDIRGSPMLLLEFAVPTAYLAREMQHGLLRIALECDGRTREPRRPTGASSGSLFNMRVWSMYCNGRKVGFAVRRQMTKSDLAIFKLMRSVSVGAGVLPAGEPNSGEGDLMYLRANFERVVGSANSESFHMNNPVGSSGQELSIFLLRS